MNGRHDWSELLPFYCSGGLSKEDRAGLEAHIAECPACRADVEFWRAVALQVKAEAGLATPGQGPLEGALARIGRPHQSAFAARLRLAIGLLRGQAAVLRTEIWISTAGLFALCFVISLIVRETNVVRLAAPIIAAAGLAMIGGPQNDPAFELSRSTPVSPGMILLTRAAMVFGFNLALAAAAGFLLKILLPRGNFLDLIRDGLGPISFLSALALFLSLWIGTVESVGAVGIVWLTRLLPPDLIRHLGEVLKAPALMEADHVVRSLWLKPAWLISLALILTVAAILRADRSSLESSLVGREGR
uniref:Putative zinc-finger domain-containing protein n=1 Tax=uncultured Aminicenantes bacterium TaxID=174294 RepID=Q2YZY5_9BACT|nr:hypothetical protein [uncultured Aminicenantes bacterium]